MNKKMMILGASILQLPAIEKAKEIWYDDSEYSLRLRRKTKIANVNAAWLNHKTKKATQKDQLNWKGYYGIRNMGDIVRIYGTKRQYHLYRLRVNVAWLRNKILFSIKNEECYKFTIIVIIRFLTIYNHILDEDIAQIEKNIRERTGQTPMWST